MYDAACCAVSWHLYDEEDGWGGGGADSSFICRKTSTSEAVIGEMLREQILNLVWKYQVLDLAADFIETGVSSQTAHSSRHFWQWLVFR